MTRPNNCGRYYPICVDHGVCYFPSFVLDNGCLVYAKELPKSRKVRRGAIGKKKAK